MTDSRKRKQEIRAIMAEAGMSYTAAMRELERREAALLESADQADDGEG